ncbi:hypothetical protein HZS_3645 [Henneguya salminicola]|nr:hypothetical protein HZS_3645 [Henneguya salminicola]
MNNSIRTGQEIELHKVLKNCGTIIKYFYFQNCNFVLVKFSTESEASEALKLNGYLLDDNSMIGVLASPCNRLPNKILKQGSSLILDSSSYDLENPPSSKYHKIGKSKDRKGYFGKFLSVFKKFSSNS